MGGYMDMLTLIVLAKNAPTTPIEDEDNDLWHADCILDFVEAFSKSAVVRSIVANSKPTSVRLGERRKCYRTNCIHEGKPWTS